MPATIVFINKIVVHSRFIAPVNFFDYLSTFFSFTAFNFRIVFLTDIYLTLIYRFTTDR